MSRGYWLTAGWLAVTALGPGPATAAGEHAGGPGVVVHLVDLAQVESCELDVAKAEVERVFSLARVQITWAANPIPVPSSVEEQQGAVAPHVVLFIVDAHQPGADRSDVGGSASRGTGRAHVFRNRIVEEAKNHQTDPALVIGRVMAHEIGHLLLPPNSHSSHGIMQAMIDFTPAAFHTFDAIQAEAIRSLLNGSGRRLRDVS